MRRGLKTWVWLMGAVFAAVCLFSGAACAVECHGDDDGHDSLCACHAPVLCPLQPETPAAADGSVRLVSAIPLDHGLAIAPDIFRPPAR